MEVSDVPKETPKHPDYVLSDEVVVMLDKVREAEGMETVSVPKELPKRLVPKRDMDEVGSGVIEHLREIAKGESTSEVVAQKFCKNEFCEAPLRVVKGFWVCVNEGCAMSGQQQGRVS